jgi:hypothetical protein
VHRRFGQHAVEACATNVPIFVSGADNRRAAATFVDALLARGACGRSMTRCPHSRSRCGNHAVAAEVRGWRCDFRSGTAPSLSCDALR